jgi:hypothetical protein
MSARVLKSRLEGPGLYSIEVVGVQHYQSEIRVVVSMHAAEIEEGDDELSVPARLLSGDTGAGDTAFRRAREPGTQLSRSSALTRIAVDTALS